MDTQEHFKDFWEFVIAIAIAGSLFAFFKFKAHLFVWDAFIFIYTIAWNVFVYYPQQLIIVLLAAIFIRLLSID